MEDNSMKSSSLGEVKDKKTDHNKLRFTLFEESKAQIDAIKKGLFSQISGPVENARQENSEILTLLDVNIERYKEIFYGEDKDNDDLIFEMDDKSSEGTDENFDEYVRKIEFFREFSCILKRVPPFCETIEATILSPIRKALNKIRLICGCNLDDYQTWNLARPYTDDICTIATELDLATMQMRRKDQHIFNEMETFLQVYRNSDSVDKANFMAMLDKLPQFKIWMHPWIEIAEGREVSFEGALIESMRSIQSEYQMVAYM